MALYPTKEEILQPYEVPEEDKEIIKEWIRKYYNGQWKKYSRNDKIQYLMILINNLGKIHDNPPKPFTGPYYSYIPMEKIIVLDRNNPSILSTLHEFGHAINGESELQACRWSVHLFMACFPKAYSKLVWKGHMLVKPNDKETTNQH